MNEEQQLREQYEEKGSFDVPEESEGFGCGGFGYLILGIAAIFILFNVYQYFVLIGSFANRSGSIEIYNEANVDLNVSQLEFESEMLRRNFGVDIRIFIFTDSTDSANRDNFAYSNFISRRDFSGIAANDLVFVIGVKDQYSELTWGANLERIDGDAIRGEALNPRLRELDYMGALLDSFAASAENLQRGDLAFGHLLGLYGNNMEAILIGLLVLGLVIWSIYYYANGGTYHDDGYHRRYYHNTWRGSSSGGGSSGSRSSGGGSSRGSWKK